ncbi:MAG: (2Fe-2S)-binding protein [Nocardioidaceae bacterium]|nr:(2Fe-2S)-binding protein [Nocardioidaceae bacterium]
MTALTVNGRGVEVDRPDDTPLLTVLRDALGLVGSRFGCGQGLCGACTVLLDGTPVASCDTPLWQAGGTEVVTVEGLAADGPNRVQQSLVEHQAAQCGFCIPGIVVRATALLAERPAATADEVAAGLERHLCRCGTHQRILQAVLAARPGQP